MYSLLHMLKSKETMGRRTYLVCLDGSSGSSSVYLGGGSVLPVHLHPTGKVGVVLEYSSALGLLSVCFSPSADAAVATTPVPAAVVGTSQEASQMFEPADTLPSRSEAAAVQPVIGISQRVQMNSKGKKDLGTLGTTPASCDGSIPVTWAGWISFEALKAVV